MNASHERATVGGTTLRGRGHSYRRGHGWMMIAGCVPMLVAAVILVAAGVVSPGFPAGGRRMHGHDGGHDGRNGSRQRSPRLTGGTLKYLR